MTKQAFKFLTIFSLIVSFLFFSFIINCLPVDAAVKRQSVLRLSSWLSKIAVVILGVRLTTRGQFISGSVLYVSNHMSYLDILLLNSIQPFCFVTSVAIKNTPVLGWIARLAGCLFVNRKDKSNLPNEINKISDVLQTGVDVLFFPEATSTNGETLLRFRRPLFNAAICRNLKVMPVCLNYVKVDGRTFDLSNRDQVCWYGDMEFAEHLWQLCSLKKIEAEISAMPAIIQTQVHDSSQLAMQTQSMIQQEFRPCLI